MEPLSVCPVCDVGVLWPNGWTDQDETWHVLGGDPAPPKGGTAPIFGPCLIVAKRLDGSRKMKLGMDVGRGPGHILLDGDRIQLLPKRGHSPQFLTYV